jgi:hypothetical protein
MFPPQAIAAVAALFIIGMVWLRTRMHYAKAARGVRMLTRAGRYYFLALALLLVLGWFAAPAVAHRLTNATPVAPTLARVVWFLAAYYLFIPVHLALRARGVELFKAPVAHAQDGI